jgi:hypothetical protein
MNFKFPPKFKNNNMTRYCVTCTENKVEKPKYAKFNVKDEKPKYCKSHSTDNMMYVNDPLCKCKKSKACYNIPGEKAMYCKSCKSENMINVKSKMCVECKTKKPSFNFPNLAPDFCNNCKKDGMVNVNNKKCETNDCSLAPNFNLPGKKGGIYCSAHAPNGYVDVNHPKCLELTCSKAPSYNISGNKIPIYCAEHAKFNMIDVKHPLCKLCNLFYIRSNSMENLCYNCYIYTYPDKPIARNHLVKEKFIVEYLKNLYPHYDWKYNKFVNSCAKYRPDLLVDLGTHVVIVEIDEHQHENYMIECENKRIMDILFEFARPLVVFRINPDSYKEEKKLYSGIFKKSKDGTLIVNNTIWNERSKLIESTFKNVIEKPTEMLTSIKLFFNTI